MKLMIRRETGVNILCNMSFKMCFSVDNLSSPTRQNHSTATALANKEDYYLFTDVLREDFVNNANGMSVMRILFR